MKQSILSNEHSLEKEKRRQFVDQTYMVMTQVFASFSRAVRAKTSAIIVKDGVVISTGFNGTPRGCESNVCEHTHEDGTMTTEPFVLHGEANAINNIIMSNSGASIKGSTMYTLYSPCWQCSALIKHVGIARVVYMHDYRVQDSLIWLRENGVIVEKCQISDEHFHLTCIEDVMNKYNQMNVIG